MAKKSKTPESPTALRRRMVLVSDFDLQSMRDAFAAKQSVTVTVQPASARSVGAPVSAL